MVYDAGDPDNTSIGGLQSGRSYVVRVIDETTIELANTATGTALSLSSPDTGTGHSLTGLRGEGMQTFQPSNVIASTAKSDTLEFTEAHALQTGDAVVYKQDSTGTAVGNLVDGETYYVIEVTQIQFGSLQLSTMQKQGHPMFDPNCWHRRCHHLIVKPKSVRAGSLDVPLPLPVSGQMVTVTAAGTGGAKSSGAGALSLNFVRMSVDSHISNTDGTDKVQASGDVRVEAEDTSQVYSGTGAIAVSTGDQGSKAIGASVGVNDVRNAVHAYIEEANVQSTAGDVNLAASETSNINVVIGGVGSGSDGISAGINCAIHSQ